MPTVQCHIESPNIKRVKNMFLEEIFFSTEHYILEDVTR